jgi:ADP-heptose:LPS heptosyltransferase
MGIVGMSLYKPKNMNKKIIRVISSGGLGDILLSTPTFYAMKKKYPQCKIFVYCRRKMHAEVYRHNPYIDKIGSFSFWVDPVSFILFRLHWARFYLFHYGRFYPSLYYKKEAAEIIAEMMETVLEETTIQVFLTKKEEAVARNLLSQYRNPIILHKDTMTGKDKEWELSKWEDLVKEMPEYSFIQMGVASDIRVDGAIDLRGKTSFREGMALVKNSLSFVGVDSSFAHVTNAFDIPGVVLFGPSTPAIWGHPNNINIYRSLRCSPCVDILRGTECPYCKECMTTITVAEVKKALLRQLRKKDLVRSASVM